MRGDGLRALDVRDVEALDAAGQLRQHQRVGERLLNGLARGLEDAEALRVGLFRVLAGEIDERAFFAALRHRDFDLVAGALGEKRGQGFAVVEVDRDEDRARDVLLIDVELLEEGREDRAGVEDRKSAVVVSPVSDARSPPYGPSTVRGDLGPGTRFRASFTSACSNAQFPAMLAGLPRKTRGGRRFCRCACGRD